MNSWNRRIRAVTARYSAAIAGVVTDVPSCGNECRGVEKAGGVGGGDGSWRRRKPAGIKVGAATGNFHYDGWLPATTFAQGKCIMANKPTSSTGHPICSTSPSLRQPSGPASLVTRDPAAPPLASPPLHTPASYLGDHTPLVSNRPKLVLSLCAIFAYLDVSPIMIYLLSRGGRAHGNIWLDTHKYLVPLPLLLPSASRLSSSVARSGHPCSILPSPARRSPPPL